MTTTTTTRSEAYDYGFTGQPFCPPPPSGLAAYEEAAWVADFHAGMTWVAGRKPAGRKTPATGTATATSPMNGVFIPRVSTLITTGGLKQAGPGRTDIRTTGLAAAPDYDLDRGRELVTPSPVRKGTHYDDFKHSF